MTLKASFAFEIYMKFIKMNYNVMCREGGACITLAQVYRMQRNFVQKKNPMCINMLTMRHQNRTIQARARRDQRSLQPGLLRRRRRGLGILTGITLRAEALYRACSKSHNRTLSISGLTVLPPYICSGRLAGPST